MSTYNDSVAWTAASSPVGSGDNAWQLVAGTLVALQSIPGLVVLYAGIMPRKWAINSAFMAFYAFCAVLICWVLWAYEASFGQQMLPFVGKPDNVLGIHKMLTQSILPAIPGAVQNFPLATMVYFQFVFAAITVIIIAGAFLGRMNFFAWMVFVPLWVTLSYTVVAFSIWGGGFLYTLGVLDYSGGYVIHLSSGTAGLIGSYWIGPRPEKERLEHKPNNLLCVLIGAGILWTGWNGFNGGDPYAANADAGVAVLNTSIATAVAIIIWTLCDITWFKKPSILGAVNGMICGLVAITPAAGFVAGWGAILLGVGAGCIPWFTMNILARHTAWFTCRFDDTLGITHTHLVAGMIGGIGTGIWATAEGCASFGALSPGGAVAGHPIQIGYQIAGMLFVIGWNTVWTSLILLFIKYVLRIPLLMTEEQLALGDDAIHGEAAYVFGPCDGHSGNYIQGQVVNTNDDDPETALGGINTIESKNRMNEEVKKGESSQ